MVAAGHFKELGLASLLNALATDEEIPVRILVAAGLHEIAIILGADSYPALKDTFKSLVAEQSYEVLERSTKTFAATLSNFTQCPNFGVRLMTNSWN